MIGDRPGMDRRPCRSIVDPWQGCASSTEPHSTKRVSQVVGGGLGKSLARSLNLAQSVISDQQRWMTMAAMVAMEEEERRKKNEKKRREEREKK